jgi:hypothetical protein
MLHPWVQLDGVGQHPFGDVYRRCLNIASEVGEQMTAADTQLKDLVPTGAQLLSQGLTPEGGLLGILFGRVKEGPKVGQVVIQSVASHATDPAYL